MSRSEITKRLSAFAERYINPNRDPRIYWAREVTFDYGTDHQIRIDYMKFKPKNNTISGIEKGDFYCFEVKSCVDDFRSKNGHNFIGDFNYYVMTEETYQKIEDSQRHPIPLVVDDYTIELLDKEKPIYIPYHVGVLVPGGDSLKVVKKAHREDRNRPVSEMLLMMFRSANRDKSKLVARDLVDRDKLLECLDKYIGDNDVKRIIKSIVDRQPAIINYEVDDGSIN